MLIEEKRGINDSERWIYDRVVPKDHVLRRGLAVLRWSELGDQLAEFYSPDVGRPAIVPERMLKLEFLRYLYGLSDRGVVSRAQTDLAFRLFLGLGLYGGVPDPSTLCVFRARIGSEGFVKVFECLLRQADEQGLLKTRLRIKDATHIVADIEIPSALALVARTREKLLKAAEPFAPTLVQGEKVTLDLLRERENREDAEERLAIRVVHLTDILAWVDELREPPREGKASQVRKQQRAWKRLVQQRELARKVLYDRQNQGDQVLSDVDPDARCGKHGKWFDGFMVDVMIDADSELITQVNVFAANDMRVEIDDTLRMIQKEEALLNHDIEKLSIDAITIDGPLLEELQDSETGPQLDLYIPPRISQPKALYTSEQFARNEDDTLTCPAGKKSGAKRRYRPSEDQYRFSWRDCATCPLRANCLSESAIKKHAGKVAHKSPYEAQFHRITAKAQTAEYQEIRKEHPKIERKISQMMNQCGGRKARCRGAPKILLQQLTIAVVTNVKRMIRIHPQFDAAIA